MSDVLVPQAERLEFTPGNIPEFDEPTRQYLAHLILDETVELENSSRGNTVRYGKLTDDELINLFRPIVKVLDLDPTNDPPPMRTHFERASKLGLVPSTHPVYDRLSLSKVQSELGFRAKYRFNDWLKSDFVDAGQKLAKLIGGRPKRDHITAAGRGKYKRLGDFPTINDITSRFGKISVFHELIGYPSCKGWVEDDYFDWASAFYRQNPGSELIARTIEYFSKTGRGPSKQPITKHFGTISNFKYKSRTEFEQRQAFEDEGREARLADIADLVKYDGLLDEVIRGMETEKQRLQISAQYRLARRLVTGAKDNLYVYAAKIGSPDYFARWCIRNSEGRVSAAMVESYASAIGVFDDLWPMYRFQNVDLSLPE